MSHLFLHFLLDLWPKSHLWQTSVRLLITMHKESSCDAPLSWKIIHISSKCLWYLPDTYSTHRFAPSHTHAALSVLSVSLLGDEWECLYEILTGHLLLCSSVWELDVGPVSLVPLWGHLLGTGTREVSRRGPCHPGRPAQKAAPPWGSIHPTCWVTEHQSSPTCQITVHATRTTDM